MKKKFLLSLLSGGLALSAFAQAPLSLPFVAKDTLYATTDFTHSNTVQAKVLFSADLNYVINLETGDSALAKGNHDFTGYLPINGSSSYGYIIVNHEITNTRNDILGDGGGMTVFEVQKDANGEWQTLGSYKNVDFTGVGDDFSHTRTAQIALGKALFFDPVLSGNQERSCASCHKPEQGFSDARVRSDNFTSDATLGRNTPSLLNVAFQQSFFWDGRVSSLEEQVKDVTLNPSELHGNFDTAALRLKNSAAYRALFEAAFPNSRYAQINGAAIQKAIAAYERSLIALNSPFDQYMRGSLNALPKKAEQGFNLFMGKALCSTCHFFPLFNGTVPPHYRKTENEVLGLASSAQNKTLDQDSGKYLISLTPLHIRSFKTSGLRNLSQTAPYMHNGAYPDLKSVIEFYNRGGGQAFHFEVENQTLPADSLGLNMQEVEALVSFLECLNDTSTKFQIPSQLPAIPGTSDRRKLGGAY
ncbi:MAG: hypothetical protein EP332_06725 [Bacteroidetes bacterium]|nr:MAG: hypothetical protein EP332_06725 [Bacteroidota bacterium]